MSQTARDNRDKNSSGFTLPELLLGVATFTIAIGIAINALLLLSSMWKGDLALIELSRNANIAIEKMVDGAAGQNTGLAAAKLGSAPNFDTAPVIGDSGGRVDYTDINDSSRSFYLSSGAIYREGGVQVLADVESATFSYSESDHTVGIALTLLKTILPSNKEVRFHIQTKVYPKN